MALKPLQKAGILKIILGLGFLVFSAFGYNADLTGTIGVTVLALGLFDFTAS